MFHFNVNSLRDRQIYLIWINILLVIEYYIRLLFRFDYRPDIFRDDFSVNSFYSHFFFFKIAIFIGVFRLLREQIISDKTKPFEKYRN